MKFRIIFQFTLLFATSVFGQTEQEVKFKIKAIERLSYNENNRLYGIALLTYNKDEKITSSLFLEGDSTQIARRSYEYNNKGLIALENSFTSTDDSLPSTRTEIFYDKTDKITQKKTFSDFKKEKYLMTTVS